MKSISDAPAKKSPGLAVEVVKDSCDILRSCSFVYIEVAIYNVTDFSIFVSKAMLQGDFSSISLELDYELVPSVVYRPSNP